MILVSLFKRNRSSFRTRINLFKSVKTRIMNAICIIKYRKISVQHFNILPPTEIYNYSTRLSIAEIYNYKTVTRLSM